MLRHKLELLAGSSIALATTGQAVGFNASWNLGSLGVILLIVTAYYGWREHRLQVPPKPLLLISSLFFLSVIWSENAVATITYTLTWSAVILTLASLRLDWRVKEVWLPVTGVLLAGIPYSLYLLAINGTTQGQGLSGNASFYAGQLVIVSLLVSWPWNFVLASVTGITGVRTVLLVIAIFSPIKVKLTVLGLGIVTSLVLFATTGSAAYQRISMNLGLTGRVELWQSSLERIKDSWFLGTGAFATAITEETNSHSLYGIILEGNGLILGSIIIAYFVWMLRSRVGLALLLMCVIDQFWLTTIQGMFLFAAVMMYSQTSSQEVLIDAKSKHNNQVAIQAQTA